MRTGTPQFNFERLKEAREARAMSAVELADLTNLSPQAISQYESGQQTPSPDSLRRIAERLDVPTHFFLQRKPKEERGILFFRSLSAATKRDRVRAIRQFDWFREIVSYLHGFVEFPTVKFPSLPVPSDPRELRNDDIEKAATAVRRFWGLGDGPISNVAWLVENHGAVMARQLLNSEALDAYSEWGPSDPMPYIILGTDKLSAVRSRFNVAHELGHLILHRSVPRTLFASPSIFNLIEEQANRFASAFLLPAQTFSASVYSTTLDGFRGMKQQWLVSIGAMIVRARQIDLINEDQMRRLFANRNRRGWRTSEPLDETLVPEQPRFLRRAFDLLINRCITSGQEMEFHLARRVADIERLTGLPDGYLKYEPDTVRLKSNAPSGGPYEWPEETENWVLKFPGEEKRG